MPNLALIGKGEGYRSPKLENWLKTEFFGVLGQFFTPQEDSMYWSVIKLKFGMEAYTNLEVGVARHVAVFAATWRCLQLSSGLKPNSAVSCGWMIDAMLFGDNYVWVALGSLHEISWFISLFLKVQTSVAYLQLPDCKFHTVYAQVQ